MINAIGEATMQQFVRTSYAAEVSNKDLEVRKTDKVRAQRPVEKSDDGKKSEMNLKSQDNMNSRNSLEDGQVVVEKYTEDGKLVKKIPPGFLPFNEMV
jgi:nitrogen fixation protein FixH